MNNSYLQKIENLQNAFGNTPLVEVNFLYRNLPLKIYAKYEAFNFSGSIKDRIAIHILKQAYLNQQLNENSIIVEATSGNTGIAFSALGKALNHQVVIFMPDWLSIERYKKMELLGAKVIKVSASEGGFLGAIAMARKYAKDHDNVFCPEQFTNPLNPQAHSQSLAKEVVNQLNSINQNISHFVAGVGTGGTIMGFHNYCIANKIDCKCYPMEPENSPTLTTGGKKIGKHRIQGISDEFIPEILKLDQLQEIISVDDGDAIIMAQKLNNRGLSVGISSGANFIGALKIILKELSLNQDSFNQINKSIAKNSTYQHLELNSITNKKLPVITTIFCDSAFKYFSTDLCNNEPIKDSFLSPDIEIIDYKFIK